MLCSRKLIYNISCQVYTNFKKEEKNYLKKRRGKFPGGAVDKTLRSQCRGPEFDPWSGN